MNQELPKAKFEVGQTCIFSPGGATRREYAFQWMGIGETDKVPCTIDQVFNTSPDAMLNDQRGNYAIANFGISCGMDQIDAAELFEKPVYYVKTLNGLGHMVLESELTAKK